MSTIQSYVESRLKTATLKIHDENNVFVREIEVPDFVIKWTKDIDFVCHVKGDNKQKGWKSKLSILIDNIKISAYCVNTLAKEYKDAKERIEVFGRSEDHIEFLYDQAVSKVKTLIKKLNKEMRLIETVTVASKSSNITAAYDGAMRTTDKDIAKVMYSTSPNLTAEIVEAKSMGYFV